MQSRNFASGAMLSRVGLSVCLAIKSFSVCFVMTAIIRQREKLNSKPNILQISAGRELKNQTDAGIFYRLSYRHCIETPIFANCRK
jgi:hypothetical protein